MLDGNRVVLSMVYIFQFMYWNMSYVFARLSGSLYLHRDYSKKSKNQRQIYFGNTMGKILKVVSQFGVVKAPGYKWGHLEF